jgi:topoisomerase-4 subunit A
MRWMISIWLRKFDKERVYSCVYFDGDSKQYYVKRFKIEMKKKKRSIHHHRSQDSKLAVFSSKKTPQVRFHYLKGKEKEKLEAEVKLTEIIDVKGWKALGNRLSQNLVTGKIVDTTTDEPEEDLEVGDTVEWDVETPKKAGAKGEQTGLF